MQTPKTLRQAAVRADWRWQDAHAVRSVSDLADYLHLSPVAVKQMAAAAARQPVKITPYYLGLLLPDDPADPLRRMVLPDPRELLVSPDESADPIADGGKHSPTPGLTHRHPERALIFPSMQCGGHCRYCFRRQRVGCVAAVWSDEEQANALEYIVQHREIREVILTGGDPLMLPDALLLTLLQRLRRIPHVRLLRVHTRMPAYNPFRITIALARGLAALHPLWVVTHFNHPRELTPVALRYLARLRRAAPLLNQSVLLRGVNDNPDVLRELGWRLAEAGIKPYYLHHPDRAIGTRHWRTPLTRGRRLWRELWGSLPGYMTPQYVLDLPGGHGKTPVAADYVAAAAGDIFHIRGPQGGRTYRYRDGKEPRINTD
ncbi:MAG: KamA family radical SAM protein [Kiritimatiellia bacterium]|jgi:lysine 2,3-aminomutase